LLLRVDLLEAMGDRKGALRELEAAREMFPDEMELFLMRARLLYLAGRLQEARAQVEEVLDWTQEGALPILCYHGITNHYEAEALSAPLFRDQLRALKEAGYTPV